MIDFGDFIDSQRRTIVLPSVKRKKKKKAHTLYDIRNDSSSIEEAKAKVQAIIESGKSKKRSAQ